MRTVVFEDFIKVQPRGVVTIPKKFRDASGIREGSIARIINEKGRLIIESVKTLDYPVRSYRKSEVGGFIDFDKKESKKLKAKGLI